MSSTARDPPPRRKGWLDLQRGLAVVCMVEVHTLDSWLAPAAPRGWAFAALQMLGGMAAPAFLFLAGLSQALSDASAKAKGMSSGARRSAALSRALRLLAVAYAFRAAEYLLGFAFLVPGAWRDLLRVDILNVIAVSLALGALLVGLPRRAQLALGLAAAALAALAAPLAAGWHHAPSRALDYLYGTMPRASFSLLPWSGFLLAGVVVGRLVLERDRPRALLAGGAALAAIGALSTALPPVYAHQDFWHTSPSWFTIRLAVLLATTGALQLLPLPAGRFEWLTVLGRHSLLGYAASVELTYGLLTRPLHRALGTPAVVAGIAVMLAVTYALSRAVEALKRRKAVLRAARAARAARRARARRRSAAERPRPGRAARRRSRPWREA